jgi:hypothetical protein
LKFKYATYDQRKKHYPDFICNYEEERNDK